VSIIFLSLVWDVRRKRAIQLRWGFYFHSWLHCSWHLAELRFDFHCTYFRGNLLWCEIVWTTMARWGISFKIDS